jgi:hypothetical protein
VLGSLLGWVLLAELLLLVVLLLVVLLHLAVLLERSVLDLLRLAVFVFLVVTCLLFSKR